MERFEQLVDEYMMCDKKTLAEMLALKQLEMENAINNYYSVSTQILNYPPTGDPFLHKTISSEVTTEK